MGQQEYDNWSLQTDINIINCLNAPQINKKEKELINTIAPKRVLDIGCGNGIRLFDYLKSKNIDFVGIEKFKRLVNNSPYSNKIIIADIVEIEIPIKDDRLKDIDLITILGGSLNGIFGINNHIRAWEKIYNLLQNGGKIIIDHLIVDGFENNDEIGELTIISNVTPPQFFLSEKQLKNIWADLKLKILDTYDINIPQYKLRYYELNKI